MTDLFISCNSCAHARVCTVIRAIGPLMAKWDDEIRPFEPDHIASLCKEYFSQEIILTIKEESK